MVLQREERYDVLVEKNEKPLVGIDEEELWWYLDTKIWFGSSLRFRIRF